MTGNIIKLDDRRPPRELTAGDLEAVIGQPIKPHVYLDQAEILRSLSALPQEKIRLGREVYVGALGDEDDDEGLWKMVVAIDCACMDEKNRADYTLTLGLLDRAAYGDYLAGDFNCDSLESVDRIPLCDLRDSWRRCAEMFAPDEGDLETVRSCDLVAVEKKSKKTWRREGMPIGRMLCLEHGGEVPVLVSGVSLMPDENCRQWKQAIMATYHIPVQGVQFPFYTPIEALRPFPRLVGRSETIERRG